MLKIFICEDNKSQRESVESIVNNYLMMMDIDANLELSTDNPSSILEWETLEQHDYLFFLDIELNHKMNGVALAARLRENYPHSKIVFITSHTEMVFLSFIYKIEALDFIQKKDHENLKVSVIEAINTTLNRVNSSSSNREEFFFIRNNYIDIKLAVSDIMFFTTTPIPHKVNIHLLNRQVEFYYNIKDIPKHNTAFYRCHQSTVVNVNNIEVVNTKTRKIHMSDGEICDVSVRYLKGLLSKLKSENIPSG